MSGNNYIEEEDEIERALREFQGELEKETSKLNNNNSTTKDNQLSSTAATTNSQAKSDTSSSGKTSGILGEAPNKPNSVSSSSNQKSVAVMESVGSKPVRYNAQGKKELTVEEEAEKIAQNYQLGLERIARARELAMAVTLQQQQQQEQKQQQQQQQQQKDQSMMHPESHLLDPNNPNNLNNPNSLMVPPSPQFPMIAPPPHLNHLGSGMVAPNLSASGMPHGSSGPLPPTGPQPIGPPPQKKELVGENKKLAARRVGQIAWEDPTLLEWRDDDYRIWVGDIGNDVTDELLGKAFSKYPTLLRARVVRDKRNGKTKGYGFVSFEDPQAFAKALREMNGRYIGNRPCKLRKSKWLDRSDSEFLNGGEKKGKDSK